MSTPQAAAPDSGSRRSLQLPRPLVLSIAVGAAVGVALGAWYRFLEHGTTHGPLPATTIVILATGAILGLLALVAIMLAIGRRTRPAARATLTTWLAIVATLPVGYVVGPRWQPEQDLPGEVYVELTSPTTEGFGGSATCRTVENGDQVTSISSGSVGTAGSLPLSVHLSGFDGGGASIYLALDGGSDLGGPLGDVEVSEDRWTGRGTFEGLRIDDLDPDPDIGWATASGTVRWECG